MTRKVLAALKMTRLLGLESEFEVLVRARRRALRLSANI
jgi:hypothetical protein